MVWVWTRPREGLEFGGEIDYDASAPATGYEVFSETKVDTSLRPVFRSRHSLKRFKALHCPPFDFFPVIDATWRDIILDFVPKDRIQFLPVRLIADGEICDDYMYAIPFDRAICIDVDRSNVGRKIVRPDITLIFSADRLVHHEHCLNGFHMARDPQMMTHLVVSDALKDALSAKGKDGVFRKVEDS